jgi:hypothetical protein
MALKELVTENSTTTIKIPIMPVVAAWLIPGGGHFWQRRWGRGALLLVSIGLLFLAGVTMQGRLFKLTPSNIVETLGFLSDFCSGLFFLGAKFAGYDPAELASPIADYGTKFLLVAGLLNVLCILDAYDIAIGKKN